MLYSNSKTSDIYRIKERESEEKKFTRIDETRCHKFSKNLSVSDTILREKNQI
jgi:hypothetical protein